MTLAGASALFDVLAHLPDGAAQIRRASLAAPELPELAARHGVAAWVNDGLASWLPAESARHLATHAREVFTNAAKIKRLTLKVFDALAERGVTPIALKGSVLSARLYPHNPLTRPSSDVDVLVSLDQLDTARGALEALGFTQFVDTASADHLDDHHHFAFTGPLGLVEVHFRLTNTFGRGLFDDAAVRQRAMPLRFEGRTIWVLGPEDEFLYLATHAATHAFLRIAWLVDLQQFLRLFPTLDFDAMAVRAAAAGFTSAVATALGLLEELLQVSLPPAARRAFPVRRGRRRFDALVFAPERVASGTLAQHPIAGSLLRLWMVDSPARGALLVGDGLQRLARRSLAARLPSWPFGGA